MSCLITIIALATAALASGEYDFIFGGHAPADAVLPRQNPCPLIPIPSDRVIHYSDPLCLLLCLLFSSKCPEPPVIRPQLSWKRQDRSVVRAIACHWAGRCCIIDIGLHRPKWSKPTYLYISQILHRNDTYLSNFLVQYFIKTTSSAAIDRITSMILVAC